MIELNFNPPKPPKCVHCNMERGEHKARTYNCPAKWSKSRAVGYTHFCETVFEPKKQRAIRNP